MSLYDEHTLSLMLLAAVVVDAKSQLFEYYVNVH